MEELLKGTGVTVNIEKVEKKKKKKGEKKIVWVKLGNKNQKRQVMEK